jgi:hypothetical protein
MGFNVTSVQWKPIRWMRRALFGPWDDWSEHAYRSRTYSLRLAEVQGHLGECFAAYSTRPIRLLSVCAGDGRDVMGAMISHNVQGQVVAWLVEQNLRSVNRGTTQSRRLGLQDTVKFLHADATLYDTYRNIAPSDIVLLSGVWGHVPASDRPRLVQALASFCKPGGMVIWTRALANGVSRMDEIQIEFASPLWELVCASITSDKCWGVVSQRYCGPQIRPASGGRIFQFAPHSGK